MDCLFTLEDKKRSHKRKPGRPPESCNGCHRQRRYCDRRRPACGRCISSGIEEKCAYVEGPVTKRPRLANDRAERWQWDEENSACGGQELGQLERTPLHPANIVVGDEEAPKHVFAPHLPTSGRPPSVDSSREPAGATLSLLAEQPSLHPSLSSGHQEAASTVINTTAPGGLEGHFGTRWSGATSVDDLMQANPGLEKFANGIFQAYPAIDRIRRYMGKIERDGYDCIESNIGQDGGRLKLLLPPEQQVDGRIRLFLNTYGRIYHIFHLPRFWKEYKRIWGPQREIRPRFVAIVLLMVAASRGLDPTTSRTPLNNQITAEAAMRYIKACEAWLRNHETTNPDTEELQLRFVLVFAKLLVIPKFKTSWVEAQNLVQVCICSGLHRDPDVVKAPFGETEKELRRCIWHAATELHIQVSLDRGSIPSLLPSLCDCRPPKSFSNSELTEFEDLLRQGEEAHNTPNVAYLAAAAESMPFRHKLSISLNSSQEPLSFEVAKQYTDQLHGYLDKLPKETSAPCDISHAYLILTLQQNLFMIHAPRAQSDPTRSGRQFSQMILWETAVETLKIHKALWDENQFALQALCNDYMRAGLCLCQMLTARDAAFEDDVEPIVFNQATELIREVTEMVTDKMIRFGKERRSVFMILAAQEYITKQRDPSRGKKYMENVARHMTDTCHKAMECKALEFRFTAK